MWRDGVFLVFREFEAFPDRCVKSNQPTDGRRVQQAVVWHHPIFYLAYLGSPVAYIVIASLVKKRADFAVGLSDEWRRKRWRRFYVAGGIVAASTATAMYGLALLTGGPMATEGWWLFLLGVLFLLGGLVYGLNASMLFTAKRIRKDFVWLRGVHPDFLADLPEWPGECDAGLPRFPQSSA